MLVCNLSVQEGIEAKRRPLLWGAKHGLCSINSLSLLSLSLFFPLALSFPVISSPQSVSSARATATASLAVWLRIAPLLRASIPSISPGNVAPNAKTVSQKYILEGEKKRKEESKATGNPADEFSVSFIRLKTGVPGARSWAHCFSRFS